MKAYSRVLLQLFGCKPIRGYILLGSVGFMHALLLSCHVVNNQGDEENTIIQKIAIFGQSGETMNVADIKKAGDEDKK